MDFFTFGAGDGAVSFSPGYFLVGSPCVCPWRLDPVSHSAWVPEVLRVGVRPAPCSWPGVSHQGQRAGGQGELCVLALWLLLWCMGLGIWLPAEPRLEKKGKSHICWSSSSCSYCSFPHSISQESPPALPDCLKHLFPKKK